MKALPGLVALLLSSVAVAAQGTVAATYQLQLVSTSPPKVAVSATLPSEGDLLVMAVSRPGNVPEVAEAGWPGLVRNLEVKDAEGHAIAVTAAGAQGWSLARRIDGLLNLRYEVDFAPIAKRGWPAPRETAFAEGDGVVLIGRSLFITTPAQAGSEVRFTLPKGWQLAAPWKPLPSVRNGGAVASPADLTENLVAFVRGTPDVRTVAGFRLEVVSFGHWQAARKEVRRTLGAALERLVTMIGFDSDAHYLVVLLPQAESGGESFHASFAATSASAPTRANVGDWGNMIAHEIFHQWNGYLLDGADYASSQWFHEGFTEYAANLALVSAKLTRPEEFYAKLAEHVSNYRRLTTPLDAPGSRKGPPLYGGGALVAFSWDVAIREATHGKRGVFDVLRALLQETQNGARKYTWSDIQTALDDVTPGDWSRFHEQFIHGTEPMPLAETCARIGLRLSQGTDGAARITVDPAASPAAQALRQALIEGRRE